MERRQTGSKFFFIRLKCSLPQIGEKQDNTMESPKSLWRIAWILLFCCLDSDPFMDLKDSGPFLCSLRELGVSPDERSNIGLKVQFKWPSIIILPDRVVTSKNTFLKND